MAGGLGLLGGPLIGATMFAIGGYAAPFGLMAVFYIIMMPIVYSALTVAAADRVARSKS